MEKEFVPYEQALKLKELGFDEECFGWWSWINGITASLYTYPMKNSSIASHFMHPNNTSAPLWQQAFDWFMKQFSIRGFIENKVAGDFGFVIYIPNEDNPAAKPFIRMSFYTNHYKTYEEARLECLKKLIEIVKNEQNKD